MAESNEDLVRKAFGALLGGDRATMLEFVDEDFGWTFLDPSVEEPQPQVCHGREQLSYWVGRDPSWSMRLELQQVAAFGDLVLVVTHVPGLDETRERQAGDRNFHVVTVRDGRIAALRACRNLGEAQAFAHAAQV